MGKSSTLQPITANVRALIVSKKEAVAASDAIFLTRPIETIRGYFLGFQGIKAEVFDSGEIVLRNHLGQWVELV